jgi:hypothetical protein
LADMVDPIDHIAVPDMPGSEPSTVKRSAE